MPRRLLVIGLDSMPPRLAYGELADRTPVLQELFGEGGRGVLHSSHPPITIPAWAVMTSGLTPGELGLYGFRHRKPGTYNEFYIASSRSVRAPRIWDHASRQGLRSIVVGVPPTYPPRPLRGLMVSCFTTPGPEAQYTYPPGLKGELERLFGPYVFDVAYRSGELGRIRRELWSMTSHHFRVLTYLAGKPWDLMFFVEIGVDRVHHAYWGYYDPGHRKHVPGGPWEKVIPEYYSLVDEEVGKLLRTVPRDTVIMVVSDHGAKAMKGAFAVNQWLEEQGYLVMNGRPRPGTDIRNAPVDWRRTKAWGWRGYYARIFLNVRGREPHGVIDPRDYEHYRDEVADVLRKAHGPNGERWETRVYRPEDLYPVVRGDAPDLIVYFDDLAWRSAGTVGWPSPWLEENDRGPDDAVHDWRGVISLYDPEGAYGPVSGEVGIRDVFEIMAEVLGIEVH